MILTDEERAMLAGELGPVKRWAIDHMVQVGRMFDAADLVPVSQAHIMGDPEAVGEAGADLLESLRRDQARVAIPTITDPRGVDLSWYAPLGQTEEMATLERRIVESMTGIGIMMTNTCINYQTVMPPVLGDHVAFGDTGVVIYSNSICGARSNFEGGPSALAAGLTGRTPRYGLHLDEKRQATRRFRVTEQPKNLTDWGLLGAAIGKLAGSYWAVPVIEGLETVPTSDEAKHMGAAMASYGSTPLFHMVGITPEAPTLAAVGGDKLPVEMVGEDVLGALRSRFGGRGDKVDVVVFAAPQLSLVEMQMVADLSRGRKFQVPIFACAAPQVYPDAQRMGFVDAFEQAGGKVLVGTCFYNGFAREVGEANGWTRILSNSAKIVNILGGYGYQPALADMAACIDAAETGVIQ
ncbi:aconitase X catalytic domain-containing protein [Agrobacterium pusense]|uniref:aconitase X catalytic domain-containing protein n=1 Tax=Agrobacterium pusense TaxID=648995 RepID=UPI002FE29135